MTNQRTYDGGSTEFIIIQDNGKVLIDKSQQDVGQWLETFRQRYQRSTQSGDHWNDGRYQRIRSVDEQLLHNQSMNQSINQ